MNVCVCVHLCVCILTLLYGLYRAASISASHGLSAKEIADRTEQFGENDIAIPPASFRELYIQQITSPIFVFQVHALVCVCVLCRGCVCVVVVVVMGRKRRTGQPQHNSTQHVCLQFTRVLCQQQCIQVFCMILFMLDDYWYFSLFTLGMLLLVERFTTQQRLRNLNDLQKMRPEPFELPVFRCDP